MGRPSPRVWPALLAAVGLAFAAVSWRTRTGAPTAALNEQPPLEATGETKQDLAKLAAAAETRPHVVFVMLDDVGFNDVGYASSDLGETTPFLDGLMADGVRVDRLYGQQVCTPSRAAMLTGKLPIHLELQHWQVAPSEPWGLPTREATMAQYLKALGYSTHMVGKWHLGHYNNASTPLNRGFDSFYGFYSGGVDYLTHVSQEACLNRTDFDDDDFRRTDHATRSPDDDALDEEGRSAHVYVKDPSTGYVWRCYRDLWDNERPVTDAHGQHQTSLMNERAIAVLERHAVEKKSEPIFAYVSYPNAHLPLQPPTELLERRNATLLDIPNHDRKNFAALMMNADESLANLTNRGLKATGLYDTAVIVIASDNGGQVSAMGGGSNYPLRGEKKYLFEGGVRAHAVIHSPLLPRAARGSSYGKLMHMSDWLPTLLQGALGASADELAGLKLPRGVVNDYGAIDGVDHWAHVVGAADAAAAAPRDELLLNIDYLDGSGDYLGYFRAALIIGDWKFIYNEKNISWFAPSDEPNFHLNNIHVSGRLTALYNVTADPGERNDLKSHYPAQMKRMLKKIQNGYLPTMLVSNYRGEDDGCYEAWDDGNFVKPWVSDLREGENARAALVADARADYEGAAFGDDGTYAVDDDADIATTLADLDALIDARR
ncbi:sulfuric ester hydrolase [Aureococcus anophagefferens]|uniref:Sulfuric ester hydrolase n=1 Tax=Aureococcus anophagefferens TaxID=44056 RepID=A0ABR1FVU5_AURAN